MSTRVATKAFVEQAYLAYFGRPVDFTGAGAAGTRTEADVMASF